MINKPNNWDNVQAFSDRPKLPLGAYVCKVLKVSVEDTMYGQQMLIGFDIAEGDYKGYYRNEYNYNTMQDKKYKGILRQWLPTNDGSEADETTKRVLKGMITAFESSNAGYTWNWDENTLVGKNVGIVMRNEEWDYNGKHGWAVRPFRATGVDTVRNGECVIPNDKPLSASKAQAASAAPVQTTYQAVDDNENLPF